MWEIAIPNCKTNKCVILIGTCAVIPTVIQSTQSGHRKYREFFPVYKTVQNALESIPVISSPASVLRLCFINSRWTRKIAFSGFVRNQRSCEINVHRMVLETDELSTLWSKWVTVSLWSIRCRHHMVCYSIRHWLLMVMRRDSSSKQFLKWRIYAQGFRIKQPANRVNVMASRSKWDTSHFSV